MKYRFFFSFSIVLMALTIVCFFFVKPENPAFIALVISLVVEAVVLAWCLIDMFRKRGDKK